MGGNMAERLARGGHQVVAYDQDPDTTKAVAKGDMDTASSLKNLASKLQKPRAVWIMVPSGAPTEAALSALSDVLDEDDLIIDGGNANYKDTMRRGADLQHKGIHLVDAGVSGGIWGLNEGYGIMVGGSPEAVGRVESLFKTLAPAPDKGYGHVGALGAGHFVKMVHNGIEYGLMQAYAEGLELLHAKDYYKFDLAQITEIWRHGTVIRSWLLDLTAEAIKEDPELRQLQAYVEDSGEGRWTVEESIELAVPLPVISIALQARFRSRQEQPFGFKLLAAMRQQFGGHTVRQAP
jgi:6-phosphogluconate dehydrogenase